MKIAIATGTRADWGLLHPLALRLSEAATDVAVIATHQHLMPEMGSTLTEILNDGFQPAAQFEAYGENAARIMAMAAKGAADSLPLIAPDAIIILGDRCEMLGIASAALLLGIPIIHIAGGTISEGAFDDSVRHAISKMATLHFPETQESARRLLRMGEAEDSVFPVGAIGVENALKLPLMSRQELTDSLDGWDPGKDFLLITMHAATLESDSPLVIQNYLLDELEKLPENYKLLLTYPNSDIDPRPLISSLHDFEARDPERIKVIPSLGKRRYLSVVALSRGVVGNSSSGLVEVPSLGVPTLNIGIRQQGRECGHSVLHVEATPDGIARGLRCILLPEMQKIAAQRINPYQGNDTINRICSIIISRNFSPFPIKKFS